jgi:1-acyl-sn-glycerol-3-phosphate acyltransferase
MIVPKLLHVVVRPVFVLVDTETADVIPGPPVQPSEIPGAMIAELPAAIEQARQQIVAQLATPAE